MCDCSQSSKETHSVEYSDHWVVVITCSKCGKKLHEYTVQKPKEERR